MSLSRTGTSSREIYTIARRGGGWAVERGGEDLVASSSRDEVVAAAHRLARAAHDAGRPAQVVQDGEPGFFPAFSDVR